MFGLYINFEMLLMYVDNVYKVIVFVFLFIFLGFYWVYIYLLMYVDFEKIGVLGVYELRIYLRLYRGF